VRVLGEGATRVALIGLNSAMETAPLIAAGELGRDQLERLQRILREARVAGLGRVVMIHHPPLPGQAKRDRGLRDAERLRDILMAEGADLVVHGHNHQTMFATVESAFGVVPVVGAPSSSAAVAHGGEPLAQAHLFTVRMVDGRAVVRLRIRGLKAAGGTIEAPIVTLGERVLTTD
ncbi:MAG: metallophosphoesterase, partial [Hyphomicrobiaceae bacterium]|nr:metallophosphoesterase [Hyphomicrobiaceae bacterium]